MTRIGPLLAALASVALIVGCGGDDSSGGESESRSSAAAPAEPDGAPAGDDAGREQGEGDGAKGRPSGTTITTGESEFGEMLFDERDQAIYIFERDPEGESACYGECAEAWPPVLTKGAPRASGATESGLLGTTKRRDGKTQVTYAGQPLYFYAHEAPGEVRCHNVNLNGGYWWVVGPDGERRA